MPTGTIADAPPAMPAPAPAVPAGGAGAALFAQSLLAALGGAGGNAAAVPEAELAEPDAATVPKLAGIVPARTDKDAAPVSADCVPEPEGAAAPVAGVPQMVQPDVAAAAVPRAADVPVQGPAADAGPPGKVAQDREELAAEAVPEAVGQREAGGPVRPGAAKPGRPKAAQERDDEAVPPQMLAGTQAAMPAVPSVAELRVPVPTEEAAPGLAEKAATPARPKAEVSAHAGARQAPELAEAPAKPAPQPALPRPPDADVAAPGAPGAEAPRAPVTVPAPARMASDAAPVMDRGSMAVAVSHVRVPAAERLTVRLDPAALGTMQVEIRTGNDGQREISVTVEKPATLALLREDRHQLEAALGRAGVAIEPGRITLDLAQPDSFAPSAGRGGEPGPGGFGDGFGGGFGGGFEGGGGRRAPQGGAVGFLASEPVAGAQARPRSALDIVA